MTRLAKHNLFMRSAAMLIVASVLLFASVSVATAATGPVPEKPNNHASSAPLEAENAAGDKVKCSDYGVLTGAMVPCIMMSIETTGVKIATELSKMLEPMVLAFLTLVIVFFGVKILQGEGQVGQKAILLLVKIAFVIGFLQIFPSFIPVIHDIMKENNQIVSNILADPADFHCDLTKYLKPGGELLWAQMDCVVGKLFGYTVGADGQPNMLLAASGLGLLSGFLFGGVLGMFVFFTLLGVLYTLFELVMKTLMAYVNGFLVATILIIIAPLFLPLALMQVTAQYFDKWWKGILAAVLMPVLITTYVMLAMLLYDKILLAPDSIVVELFDKKTMERMQSINEQICSPSTSNSQELSIVAGEKNGVSEAERLKMVRNKLNETASGNNEGCVKFAAIDAAQIWLEKIFIDLVKVLVTAMVIAEGLKVVQQSVRNITGSSMVSSAIDPVSTLEKKTHEAMQSAQSEIRRAAGDKHGADFLQAVPDMVRGGLGGFGVQIERKTD